MPSIADTQRTWLITGCNRGIGLEMTRRLLESSANVVIATVRDASKPGPLHALKDAGATKGELHIISLELDDWAAIRASVPSVQAILGDRGLDYLVNNAAINGRIDTAFTMDVGQMCECFVTNVAAPAVLAQAYVDLLAKSAKKTIVNISSTLGSIGADWHTEWAGYSVTKTGLNMLTYKQKVERPDLCVVSICPGWLKTRLGGDEAPLEVEDGVSGVLKVVLGLKPSDTGRFFNYRGEEVPW